MWWSVIQGCRVPLFTLTVLLTGRPKNSILKIAGARTLLWSVYFSYVMAEQQSDLQFSWLLRCVRLFVTPWTTCQASLSITNCQSLLKLMSIESVMPSNHLMLCHPLLLPLIPPSIRVFSNESALHIRWPKYCSFSFNISLSNKHTQDWSPLGWTGWISLQSKERSRVFSSTTVQKHQFFGAQLSL